MYTCLDAVQKPGPIRPVISPEVDRPQRTPPTSNETGELGESLGLAEGQDAPCSTEAGINMRHFSPQLVDPSILRNKRLKPSEITCTDTGLRCLAVADEPAADERFAAC